MINKVGYVLGAIELKAFRVRLAIVQALSVLNCASKLA